MTDSPTEGAGSFSDSAQAARFRDILNKVVSSKIEELTPSRRTGMILDIYQGGAAFNSDITVESSVIPRTKDNPERTYVARVRCDDKFDGEIVEARIDPNLIPIFRKAEFFDEFAPSGSGTMVDRAGRYVTVGVVGGDPSPLPDTYPSLTGTTLLAPQAAPRVALSGNAGTWRVTELIRGVLAVQVNPGTLMAGPDYASFDTSTLVWGGTISFARGSEIRSYEVSAGAPIVTYGGDPLEVSATEPVEIVLGQRSGSMYLNFSSTDGVPVLVWVEAGSDIPIPPEWFLVFARINEGLISSKLIFASMTDFRSPLPPANFDVTYAATGYQKIGASFSWDAVTQGTNGDPIVVDSYEIWGKLVGEDWRRITSTQATEVAGVSFDADADWNFKVRAMGANKIPGVFSGIEAVSFPADSTPLGGGSHTYWQDTKPLTGNTGDEWFDTANGNAHYIYDGVAGDYLFAPFGGQAIADAAIGNAQIGTLSVAKLTGDVMSANVQLAGSIELGSSGLGQVFIDYTGIRVYDGTLVQKTAFNTTGDSVFKGNIEAAGIEANGPVKMHSNVNEISSGATLLLAGGVSAPATAPQVNSTWATTTLIGPDGNYVGNQGTLYGVCWDSTATQWVSLVCLASNQRFRAYRHNADGTYASTAGTWADDGSTDWVTGRGVAVSGGEIWRSRYKTVYNTGTFDFDYTGAIVSLGGTTKTLNTLANVWVGYPSPIIGQATATQILVHYPSSSVTTAGTMCLFNVSTSAKTSSITVATALGQAAICYADAGSGNRYLTWLGGTVINAYTTAGVLQTAERWHVANTTTTIGLGVKTGIPFTADMVGTVSHYDGPMYADGSEPVFTQVWRDDSVLGTGLHETAESPLSNAMAIKKRARILVYTATLYPTPGDDGVNKIRVYGAFGASAQRYEQATQTSNAFEFLDLVTTGDKPGDIPPFPATDPGTLRNSTNSIILPGNDRAKLEGINIPIEIGNSVNLNTITTGGLYTQMQNAETSLALNYPVALAGMLEVGYTINGSTDYVWQRYSTYGTSNAVYTRTLYNGTWYPWKQLGAPSFTGFKALTDGVMTYGTSGYNRMLLAGEQYDTHNGYTAGSGIYIIPAGFSGAWHFDANSTLSSNATGRRFIQLELGTAAAGNAANTTIARMEIGTGVANAALSVSADWKVAAGDYISAVIYQTSGASMSTPSTTHGFSGHYLGSA